MINYRKTTSEVVKQTNSQFCAHLYMAGISYLIVYHMSFHSWNIAFLPPKSHRLRMCPRIFQKEKYFQLLCFFLDHSSLIFSKQALLSNKLPLVSSLSPPPSPPLTPSFLIAFPAKWRARRCCLLFFLDVHLAGKWARGGSRDVKVRWVLGKGLDEASSRGRKRLGGQMQMGEEKEQKGNKSCSEANCMINAGERKSMEQTERTELTLLGMLRIRNYETNKNTK